MRGCFHSFSATILHIFSRIQRLCASLCFLSLLLSERWHTLSRIHCWDEHHRVDDKTQRRNHRRYLQNLKSLMRLLHRLCWSRFTIALPNLWSVLQVKVSLGKISDEVTTPGRLWLYIDAVGVQSKLLTVLYCWHWGGDLALSKLLMDLKKTFGKRHNTRHWQGLHRWTRRAT